MRIYVGNLSFQTTEDNLRTAFEAHGEVQEVAIVMDRDTGRSRGFGFVTMPDSGEANAAIEAINGSEVDGRTVNASEARPRPSGGGGGGGGGGRRDRY
ncbi:MAG: RNA-binding protein [Phycisphaeraceae bacterium]|nr:RNA-binding protein [Phycisphaeraceae bacterium]